MGLGINPVRSSLLNHLPQSFFPLVRGLKELDSLRRGTLEYIISTLRTVKSEKDQTQGGDPQVEHAEKEMTRCECSP